ncbi:MAG: HlyC/CorC family transporter [Gammaproteobacteria bacterium]
MGQEESSLSTLLVSFGLLIVASAYFSGSETGMMRLNRYRLRHLMRNHHPGATRASKLLDTPDKLIGVILIGNNFVNFLAASIATSIAIEVLGDPSPLATAVVLTIVVLIFAEVTPKTIAAMYPESIAYPSSILLTLLLKLLFPMVWLVNFFSNGLVRLLGFHAINDEEHHLSAEELRTIVYESGPRLPRRRHGMLMNIFDLEKVSVDDIMVAKNDIVSINIDDSIPDMLEQIANSHHTRIPVHKGNIDNIIGILHMRSTGRFLKMEVLNKAQLLAETAEPYFVPESTPLHTQLFNFQKKKERIAIVVDEFGAVKGLLTLEDILEEIVGEFTTDFATSSKDIHDEGDGTFLIDGTTLIRDINRHLDWDLDVSGAKTINGLIVELLQSIPDAPVGIDLSGYFAEIIQIKDNRIRTVRMWEAPAAEIETA